MDEQALRTALQADLNMGVVDKQTVSERLGYNWESVQERLGEQQQASDNFGEMLLRSFESTGGKPVGGAASNEMGMRRQPIER